MHIRKPTSAAAILMILSIFFGCMSTYKDYDAALSENTIESYEAFLLKHPRSNASEQAYKRLDELYAQQHLKEDWRMARRSDTVVSYESFLCRHSDGELAEQARYRMEALKTDFTDWETALKLNTIDSYASFIQHHPNSPFSEKAEARIIDIEVSDITVGPHRQLPPASRVTGGGGRTYSIINIHNNTLHNLTIRYSGPESFKVVFSPGERGSLEYLCGTYKIVATVDAANVKNYVGEAQSDGATYIVNYYIESTDTFSLPSQKISLPQMDLGFSPKFQPWPCKRRVPDYLIGQ